MVLTALMAFISSGIFAQTYFSMSAGAGGLFSYGSNFGAKDEFKNSIGYRNLSFGGSAYFDATFAELGLNYAYGLLTNVAEVNNFSLKGDMGSVNQIGFSFLLKVPFYPFKKDSINVKKSSFAIFPLMGFDCYWGFSYKKGKDNFYGGNLTREIRAGDFNQFGFLAGAGFDLTITGPLYLRTEVLYRHVFGSKLGKDLAKENDMRQSIPVSICTKICIGVKVWDPKF